MSKRNDPFGDFESDTSVPSKTSQKGGFDIGRIKALPTYNERCPAPDTSSVKSIVPSNDRDNTVVIEPNKFKLYQLSGESIVIESPFHNHSYYVHLTTIQAEIQISLEVLENDGSAVRKNLTLKRGQVLMLMNRLAQWIILSPWTD